MNPPRRIMIFGVGGSGKSTFAIQLSKALKLPLYHLDRLFFTKNWVERDEKEFLDLQQEIVNTQEWIIDGNALKSLEMRYKRANVALYFAYPRWLCLLRILKRRFFKDIRVQDRPEEYGGEKIQWKFLTYTWNFEKRITPLLHDLRARYPEVVLYKITNNKERDVVFKELLVGLGP